MSSLPCTVEANPHCGPTESWSSEANLAASRMRAMTSCLSSSWEDFVQYRTWVSGLKRLTFPVLVEMRPRVTVLWPAGR
jgi:hypothetical protein